MRLNKTLVKELFSWNQQFCLDLNFTEVHFADFILVGTADNMSALV